MLNSSSKRAGIPSLFRDCPVEAGEGLATNAHQALASRVCVDAVADFVGKVLAARRKSR